MKPTISEIRRAVADYIQSEGVAHREAEARLAKLLHVPKYADGSGFQFQNFNSLAKAKEKP